MLFAHIERLFETSIITCDICLILWGLYFGNSFCFNYSRLKKTAEHLLLYELLICINYLSLSMWTYLIKCTTLHQKDGKICAGKSFVFLKIPISYYIVGVLVQNVYV